MNKVYIIKYNKGELLVGNSSPINYPHYETYSSSDLAEPRLEELQKEKVYLV